MFEELYAPLPDVDAYLDRMGYTGPTEPTLQVLDDLVYAHLTHVPFENVDIVDRGLLPDLGIEALFDKIVVHRRGGYCFEMNALFTSLLRALGFECISVLARGAHACPPPAVALHRGIVVTIDGARHWCDVGYGKAAPALSVPIDTGEIRHTPTGDYQVIEDGKWYTLVEHKNGDIRLSQSFASIDVEECDFVPPNYYTSMLPTSMFHNVRMVNLYTATGSKSIQDNVFRIRENGALTERTFEPATELEAILKEHFGIVLD